MKRLKQRLTSRYSLALVFSILVLFQLAVATFSIHTLSAVRAYITAESLYSKGQKDAFLSLYTYLQTQLDEDYQKFVSALVVPQSSRQARLALQKPVPDRVAARKGFIGAKNHPADVDSMIWLFLWGEKAPFMARPIEIWAEADASIEDLRQMVYAAREQVLAGNPNGTAIQFMRVTTPTLNERLTRLENKFSEELGKAARIVQILLIVLNMTVAAVLVILGGRFILKSIRAQRQSETDIRELVNAVGDAVIAFDVNQRIVLFSRAAEKLFGCTAEEANGQEISRFLHGKLLRRFVHPLSLAGAAHPVTGLRTDGTTVMLEASVSGMFSGGTMLTTVVCRDVTEKHEALVVEREQMAQRHQELSQKVRTDALTGLANREALEESLSKSVAGRGEELSAAKPNFAVLFLDLDGFKAVNDNFGHLVGDELLQLVAKRLLTAVRGDDQVFRVSGDEFVVVAHADADPRIGEVLAKRVLLAVQEPYVVGEHTARVTVSIGVVNYPKAGADPRSLLRAADAAMYHAKQSGKNKYHIDLGDAASQIETAPVP